MWLTSSARRALLLSTLSAGATLLGGLFVIVRGSREPLTSHHLAFTCGLASSVMAFVSFVEMIGPAALDINVGVIQSLAITIIAFALTALAIRTAPIDLIIDKLGFGNQPEKLPSTLVDQSKQPVLSEMSSVSVDLLEHEPSSPTDDAPLLKEPLTSPRIADSAITSSRTLRLGLISCIVQTIHNAPEGLAVILSSSSSDANGGLLISIAMGAHNAVEGILIAAPIFAATRSVSLTLSLTAISGITELVASLISLSLLSTVLTTALLHQMLAAVGGIMLSVVSVELMPTGINYKRHQSLCQGLATGFIFMALTHFAIEMTV